MPKIPNLPGLDPVSTLGRTKRGVLGGISPAAIVVAVLMVVAALALWVVL